MRRTLRGLAELACLLSVDGCFETSPATAPGEAPDAGSQVRADARADDDHVDGQVAEAPSGGDASVAGPARDDAAVEQSDDDAGGEQTGLPARHGAVLCSKRWPFRAEQLPDMPSTGWVIPIPGGQGPQFEGPAALQNSQVVASDARGRVLLTGLYTKAIDLGTGPLPIQDPSAQFSAGGAFVVELSPACEPVWATGLLAPDPSQGSGGMFAAFDPAGDRVRVGIQSGVTTILATLDGAGTLLSKSQASAAPVMFTPWAITPSGAVVMNALSTTTPQLPWDMATTVWRNVTFAPDGSVTSGPPLPDAQRESTYKSDLTIGPDGSLSWAGTASAPLELGGQTLTGSGEFHFVAGLDPAGGLSFQHVLRDGIDVATSDSLLRVARDAAGNSYALDLLSANTDGFVYDLLLRKFDPTGQLVWETHGSVASKSVEYAWLRVDELHGSVALAFMDADSVTIGTTQVATKAHVLVTVLDSAGAFAFSRDLGDGDQIAGWAFNPLGELVIAGESFPTGMPDYELFVTKLAP